MIGEILRNALNPKNVVYIKKSINIKLYLTQYTYQQMGSTVGPQIE